MFLEGRTDLAIFTDTAARALLTLLHKINEEYCCAIAIAVIVVNVIVTSVVVYIIRCEISCDSDSDNGRRKTLAGLREDVRVSLQIVSLIED